MIVSMTVRILGVITFMDVRVHVEHACVNMRMSVIVSLPPAQEQACRQKYDDQPNRHLGALKQSCRQLPREQQ
jgi:hypothetical protein